MRQDDPDQDNISFTVIKVNDASVRPMHDRPARQAMAVTTRPRGLTTVVPEPVLVQLPVAEPLHRSTPEPSNPTDIVADPAVTEEDPDGKDVRPAVIPRRFAALG
jgi:hypothetical protein